MSDKEIKIDYYNLTKKQLIEVIIEEGVLINDLKHQLKEKDKLVEASLKKVEDSGYQVGLLEGYIAKLLSRLDSIRILMNGLPEKPDLKAPRWVDTSWLSSEAISEVMRQHGGKPVS